jgi:MIP family channel proteins
MTRTELREYAAEFLGTYVLLCFGTGVVAQTVLSGGASGGPLSIHLAWGVAVAMGVLIAGGVSGAHLNPAMTLALAIHRGFPWRKVPGFIAAQVVGALFGAATVFATYYEALKKFDGGVRLVHGATGTAGIFATYPQDYLSPFPGGVVDQVLGTALLTIGLFALTDERNNRIPRASVPWIVGAMVAGIGMSFGLNCGYPLNPARDFGPRLFTYVAGWGSAVFGADDHWWWVPIVAPCVGAVLGGAVYDFLITRLHQPLASSLGERSAPQA